MQVLEQSALYPAAAGYEGHSTPAAVLYNDQVHLFYAVLEYSPDEPNERLHVALHHAVSADGLSGWLEDEQALLRAGDLSWASREVYSPTAVAEGQKLHLWFSGHSLDWRDGYSTGLMGVGLMADVSLRDGTTSAPIDSRATP